MATPDTRLAFVSGDRLPGWVERAVAAGYFATRSHATDPILCAAGAESLDIVVEEDMPGRAAHIERRIRAGFFCWALRSAASLASPR